MKVLNVYKQKHYLVTHYKCCTFVADENEVKQVAGQYNEPCLSCVCPICGEKLAYITIKECDEYGNPIKKSANQLEYIHG